MIVKIDQPIVISFSEALVHADGEPTFNGICWHNASTQISCGGITVQFSDGVFNNEYSKEALENDLIQIGIEQIRKIVEGMTEKKKGEK